MHSILRKLCRYHKINTANKFVPQLRQILKQLRTLNTNFKYPQFVRRDLTTMKLDTPQFHALFTPELKTLIELFNKHHYELRIAGGAVRDLLMGNCCHDVDFATTATPDQMKEMFELEGIRMINAKGEKHGTITARINDKENFEVTTLRIDVLTDGRHAEVEFTKDWEIDANRRDLTINAMFLGFDGTIYDYFGGIEDVKRSCVKFVGAADTRIKEDYLRILRYFRFYGRIAKSESEHDEEALSAITQNAEGLAGISGERIWMELKKIVCGNFAGSIMQTMVSTGISKYLGLPQDPNVEEFQLVCSRSHDLDPQPMTRMPALLRDESEVYELNKRLKMSRDELGLGLFVVKHRDHNLGDQPIRSCKHLLIDVIGQEKKVQEKICELLKYRGEKQLLDEFSEWKPPNFPVTGYDLMEKKVPKGPHLAKLIHELRQRWKLSDFTLSKKELLDQVDEILKQIT